MIAGMPPVAGAIAAGVAGLVLAWVAVRAVRRLRGPNAAITMATGPAVEMTLAPNARMESSVPASAPPDPCIAHPFAATDTFVGRFAERQALSEWLKKKKCPSLQAVVADGGTGKSSLAWVWLMRDVLGETPEGAGDPPDVRSACRVAPKSRPEGILWWSFDHAGAGFGVFLDNALAYLTAGAVRPGSYLSSRWEKMETLLGELARRRYLIVLDGFERELRAFAAMGAAYQGDAVAEGADDRMRACTDLHAAEFLRRLAAQPTESRVLITSRLLPLELGASPGSGVSHWALGGLEPADAVSLMRCCRVEGKDAEIETAGEPVGFHPLSMRLLAGIVTGVRRCGHIRGVLRLARATRDDGRYHHIALAACEVLDPRLQQFLSHLAVLRRPVSAEQASMFNAFGTSRPVSDALKELVTRGIMTRSADGETFDMHPIVRRAAYRRLPDRRRVHSHLVEYFGQARLPAQITSLEELQPAIDQYNHLVGARRHEEAYALLSGRLAATLRDRFADQQKLRQLASGLFEDTRPRLRQKSDQVWAISALAKACSYSGETSRAAALCEANLESFRSKKDAESLAVILGILAGVESRLGRLKSAESRLRELVSIFGRLGSDADEAVARSRLGLLLAHRGAFDEALAELDTAFETVKESADRQIQAVCFSYYTQRALLMGDADAAVDAARKSRALVEESARRLEPDEHDYVRSGYLIAASLVAQGAGADDAGPHLDEAERYLSDAMSRCRRGDMVGFEPDLLLTQAKWFRLAGRADEARGAADDALAIAVRCEYRLKEAEIHNVVARLALGAKDRHGATEHARLALERAECDGAPYRYRPALEEAERLLEDAEAKKKQAAAA